MAKTYVLDRVAADLARGYTHPAIQRLSSLVAAYPNDLDLRRRLAAVHRRVGNRIQAGRWDYLTIGAPACDTQAFEQAFPSAVARLRQVRWPFRAGEAATSYARHRLANLVAAARAERPGTRGAGVAPADGPARRPLQRRGTFRRWWQQRRLQLRLRRERAALIAAAMSTPLAGVGVYTVLEWIVQ